MQLLLRAALPFIRLLWQRWERLADEPLGTQKHFLFQLIRRNQATAFGRDHRFGSIRTLAEYRSQIPIGDYERFRPYVERAKQGEAATLTQEPVLMFNMTSGSTGEPKLIPVTESARRIHSKLTRLWFIRSLLDHPRLFAGKMLALVGAAAEGQTPSGIPYGSASGLIYQSSPSWVKRAHALPYEISEIKDFTAKYYVAMRLALEQEITFLGTPNPSTILRLVETANQSSGQMIKDIRDGTISTQFDMSGKIRSLLSARIKANPARARELEDFIKAQGSLRPASYWPKLQLVGCWTGGSVGIRLKELDSWFGGGLPVRDLGYLASEAQMSLPISDHSSAGILAIDANFYEFIPETEIESANPTVLNCDELEEGGIYYVILTTSGGLYRYDINDLVRVTGFYHKTPMIEFLRKGRDVTSLTGEKLHVNQVIQAMNETQRITGQRVRHYRAVADVTESRYRFMVEFEEDSPTPEQLRQLLAGLDHHLHQLNVEYAQKRQSRRLQPPLLHVMKPGWFERRDQTSLRQGARDVQFKARLLTDRIEDEAEILLTIGDKDSGH
jgi:hypothetical protein